MTISKRIKEFRTSNHLTVLELANSLGIAARTLGSYERGEILPGYKFYDLLIQKYNVNINWLISGIGSMFINQDLEKDKDSISQLQYETGISNDDMQTLIEMLKTEAGKNIILKFIETKRGNKNSLKSLISILQGISVVF